MMSVEDESLELPSMTADHWKHVARPFLEANPSFARPRGGGDGDKDEEDDEEEEEEEEDDEEPDYEAGP